MRHSSVYSLYRKYAEALQRKVAKPIKTLLCEEAFVHLWQSLSISERNLWEARFKTGFETVILNESRQYAAVMNHEEKASLKAA